MSNRTPVDLSELQNLTFGPAWENPRGNFSRQREERGNRFEKRHPRHQGFERMEERSQRLPAHPTEERKPTPVHSWVIQADIYPEESVLQVLVKTMRASCKTYELFSVVQKFLEKPERFVVVLKPQSAHEGSEKTCNTKLYVAVPDSMPFETEDAALQHVFQKHASSFLDTQEIETEAPKGNFTFVNICGVTGELLGPSNYHRYQELIHEHHRLHASHMPFERWVTQIKTSREPEQIAAWVQKMSKETQYICKWGADEKGEPLKYRSQEAAQKYLLANHKEKLVKEVDSFRLPGKQIELLPEGPIKHAIHLHWEKQKRFPLDTANNIRSRLRRANFALYKKGNKGISFVCAVKRKFRQAGMSFADSIQKLMQFLEANPGIKAQELPQNYIASLPAEISAEEQESLKKQLQIDLHWLITEGFVIQYEDDSLLLPPVRENVPAGKEAKVDEESSEIETASESNATSDEMNVTSTGEVATNLGNETSGSTAV